MITFYRSLMRPALGLLVSGSNALVTAGSFLLALLTALNKGWADQVSETWNGFSPWYALVPLMALFMYGVLRANFDKFRGVECERTAAEDERDEAQAALAARERSDAFRDRLAEFLHEGNNLRAELDQALLKPGGHIEEIHVHSKMDEWGKAVEEFLPPHLVARWRKEPDNPPTGYIGGFADTDYFRHWIVARTNHLDRFLREFS